MDYQRKSIRRQGFTIIELLVVVGIIAVLAAIAFTAFQAMQRSASEKRTRTMLANASAMLAEYGAGNAMKDQPSMMWTPGNTPYTNTGRVDFWKDAVPNPPAIPTPPAPDPGDTFYDGLVIPPGSLGEHTNWVTIAAVRNTEVAMHTFMSAPNFQKMASGLPSGSTYHFPDDTANTPKWNESVGPVLLDSWDNPIIFVPASGLRNVGIGDGGLTFIVTSVKTFPTVATASTPTLPNGQLAPGARAFFASAGPDGNFATGDDNLYSFEK